MCCFYVRQQGQVVMFSSLSVSYLEKLELNLFEIWLTDGSNSNNQLIRFFAMICIMDFPSYLITAFQP